MKIHVPDPSWINGNDPEMEDYEAVPWDESDDPSPNLPEEQAEWEALEIYERNLDRNY